MKKYLLFAFLFCFVLRLSAQDSPKYIHVVVALADNENQGIVPIPASIGNGQNPNSNLYWGAGFGIRNWFHRKTTAWKLIKKVANPAPGILERCVFQHIKTNSMMVADAWDGAEIKPATAAFLQYASGGDADTLMMGKDCVNFGGNADLIVYIGHNGLMDFDLDHFPEKKNNRKREVIMLACVANGYFADALKTAGAYPLVWTTGLMAPEAYTLSYALDAWLAGKSREDVRLRAAQGYHDYQKCGINGARNLFATGF